MTTSKDDDSSRRYGRIGDVARKRLLDTNTNKNNTNESIASSNNTHRRTMVTSSSSASSTEPIKKRAAVLVLLFENTREEIHVVLTKRSADMNSHAGQVAFPGGKLDDEDLGDDIECALREAKEEIGLNRNHVKVLTVLPPILSAGLISVRPVVCAVTDVRNFSKMDWLRNQPSEVERTFSVRLDQFLREDERHTFNDHAWKNAPCAIRVHSFRVDEEEMQMVGEGKESSKESSSSSNNNNSEKKKKKTTSVCWGLTAAVLIETAKIVYNKEPEFERDCVLEGGASIWDLVANKDGTGVELRPGVSKI
jgi:coenzyme A diphosphatase NUDT7